MLLLLVLLPVLDGQITPQEGWRLLGVSSITGASMEGVDLDSLFGVVGPDSLYLAITTANTQNWNASYGFGLDVDRVPGNGFDRNEGAPDAHGRALTFQDSTLLDNRLLTLSVDAEIYLDWDATQGTLTPYLYIWNGAGWVQRGGLNVAWTADTGGVRILELAVAVDSLGGRVVHLVAWTTSTTGSALDCIPSDPACANSADEFTDTDTLTWFVRLSPWNRSGAVISEVLYDAPSGMPEPASEWVELFNPTLDTLDLSFAVFSDDPNPGASEGYVRLPQDAVIPPGGFLLLVNDVDTFQAYWGSLLVDPLYAATPYYAYAPYRVGTISLANTGDDAHLFRPVLPSPWDTLVEEDVVWWGNGGDIGPTDAAVDAPAGFSIERNPQMYPVWSRIPAQDFFANATPSPGNLPPQVMDVSLPLPSGAGRFTVSATVRDFLPSGDSVVADTMFYRFYSTSSGWGPWFGALRDSSLLGTAFYSFDTTATGAESVQYFVVAVDVQGARFGDTSLTGLVTTRVEEPPFPVPRIALTPHPGGVRVGPHMRPFTLEVFDLSGRRVMRLRVPPSSRSRVLPLALPTGTYLLRTGEQTTLLVRP